MILPSPQDLDIKNKKVILRADLDQDPEDLNHPRIKSLTQTLDYLKQNNCQIVIISKRGRPASAPDGTQGVDENLSLRPFQNYFDKWGAAVEENLRFDPRETQNSEDFAKELAQLGDVYINESFAVSHREDTSIVTLPKLLPHAAGFHFIKEVENLEKVRQNPTRPLVTLISGIKKDKLDYVESFKEFSDKVLIAGRLPEFIDDSADLHYDPKVIVAKLTTDHEDITIKSIESFEEEIAKAGTIILSGPTGFYEQEGTRQGTDRVFNAIASSDAFKLAGGGDTYAAIKLFSLEEKFNWISVGGGAMLEFLSTGTLPGIEALLH